MTKKQINKWKGHNNTIYSVSYNLNGSYIISTSGGYKADSENVIKVWDSNTGKLLHVLNGHSGVATCAVISPNGKEIASSVKNKTFEND